MKSTFLTLALISIITFTQANPQNLYEQLCEVNQEWYKNRPIAAKLGFLNAPIIENEQDLLVFHIQTLEKIFLTRSVEHLSITQKNQRQKHLKVLHEYWQRRDCPRNFYLPYRNPVFIDHQGRYCAVGYLMLKSGKKEFCEAVQKNSNFIYIRDIESQEFDEWQEASGLSLDELAWIQPGYIAEVQLEQINHLGVDRNPIILDSAAAAAIYNHNHDFTDMFGFNRIYLGDHLNIDKELKKYPYYQGKPDWNTLHQNYGSPTALIVYKGALFVAADTTIILPGYTTYEYHCKLLKWNRQKQWEKVFDIENPKLKEDTLRMTMHASIHTFFMNKGKLYAGGGYDISNLDFSQETSYSYLLEYNGKTWRKINQEYGGHIFGLIYKNGKRYLGTVVAENFSKRAPINPASDELVKN